jgi:hypothetical protein
MSEENTVITSLRTIRIVTEAIVKQTFGHDYRNRMLAVMRREMEVIISKHADFDGDYYLRDQRDVREQLRDGLQAVALLLHGGGDGDGDPNRVGSFETHRQVNDRLKLLNDLASFLIQKAEEVRGQDEQRQKWLREPEDLSGSVIPIVVTETFVPPQSIFDAYLDEVDPAPNSDINDVDEPLT